MATTVTFATWIKEGFLASPDCVKTPFMVSFDSLRTGWLTTNGIASFETRYLAVRPERRRRAPIEFSPSLSLEMTNKLHCHGAPPSCHLERSEKSYRLERLERFERSFSCSQFLKAS
jgi:hypothetical protein